MLCERKAGSLAKLGLCYNLTARNQQGTAISKQLGIQVFFGAPVEQLLNETCDRARAFAACRLATSCSALLRPTTERLRNVLQQARSYGESAEQGKMKHACKESRRDAGNHLECEPAAYAPALPRFAPSSSSFRRALPQAQVSIKAGRGNTAWQNVKHGGQSTLVCCS